MESETYRGRKGPATAAAVDVGWYDLVAGRRGAGTDVNGTDCAVVCRDEPATGAATLCHEASRTCRVGAGNAEPCTGSPAVDSGGPGIGVSASDCNGPAAASDEPALRERMSGEFSNAMGLRTYNESSSLLPRSNSSSSGLGVGLKRQSVGTKGYNVIKRRYAPGFIVYLPQGDSGDLLRRRRKTVLLFTWKEAPCLCKLIIGQSRKEFFVRTRSEGRGGGDECAGWAAGCRTWESARAQGWTEIPGLTAVHPSERSRPCCRSAWVRQVPGGPIWGVRRGSRDTWR